MTEPENKISLEDNTDQDPPEQSNKMSEGEQKKEEQPEGEQEQEEQPTASSNESESISKDTPQRPILSQF